MQIQSEEQCHFPHHFVQSEEQCHFPHHFVEKRDWKAPTTIVRALHCQVGRILTARNNKCSEYSLARGSKHSDTLFPPTPSCLSVARINLI